MNEMEMLYKKPITILSWIIAVLAAAAAASGIFSTGGPGEFVITSVRGDTVRIYGEGLYKHMSSDVAIQGIAQDYITLFVAVPLLLLSLYVARKGSLRGRLMLSGVLFYFMLTYLFYLTMAMYNVFFLGYVVLLSSGFFAVTLSLLSFDIKKIVSYFKPKLPVKLLGGFLIFNAILIGLLWLSVILPSLISGTNPVDLDHYTTLIVQGLDLALFLPISFLSGYFLIKRKAIGYIFAPVYLVFLSILMTALSAKIIGMTLVGVNAFPAIIIIPIINLTTLGFTIFTLKNVDEKGKNKTAPIHLNKSMA
jgi:hypothetical protein